MEAAQHSPSVVQLREVVRDDLPILFEHHHDPHATSMATFPSRDRPAFAAHWTRIWQDDAVIICVIVVEGQVIGNIGSFVASGHRQVGYWIGKPCWGRGIATAALKLFLAIDTERPLWAYVASHNHGSCRVLEKCGFVIGADNYRSADGVVKVQLVLLKPERRVICPDTV